MKKIALAAMVAMLAFTLASSASADNGKSRGHGEGLWKRWTNFQKKWDKKSLSPHERGNAFGLFGDCGKDARTELAEVQKEAFEDFMTAKTAAKDERADALEDADGDADKVAAAWKEYGEDIQKAWSDYTGATIAALGAFRTDFSKCDVVVKTPHPSVTPLPEYTIDQVSVHDELDDCWIVVDEKVYNITKLVDTYSDGDAVFGGMCGEDANTEIEDLEEDDDDIYDTLTKYKIGTLED